MKKLNIKIILILLIFIGEANVSHANIIGNRDTLPPVLVDSIEGIPNFQKPIKYIVVKDKKTGKEIVFKEGDKIVYYRKDRDEKYNKRIEAITDNGFIVKNQYVQLINIAKIKVVGSSLNNETNFIDIEKEATIQVFTQKPAKKIITRVEIEAPIKKQGKYIIVKDSETGKEIVLEEGDRIIYYRKDRDEKYRKTIETITDNEFIVKNQNVKLTNLSKIKKQNVVKSFLSKVLPFIVLLLGCSVVLVAGVELGVLLGTFIIGLVLTQLIGFLIGGLLILTIGILMLRSSRRKISGFFDLGKTATIRIFNKK